MTAALSAEWLKLTTTLAFRGLLYGAAAVGLLAAFYGTAQGPPPWDARQPLSEGMAWQTGSLAVVVLAVLVGSRTVTEEFSFNTIAHTFLADPRRGRSMSAKAAIAAAASLLIATVNAGVIGATAYTMAAVTGGDLRVFPVDGAAVLGLLAAASAMSLIGVGVGAVVRQPVPVLVGVVLWLFVAENLLGLIVGPVAGFLPGRLAVGLSGVLQGSGGASVAAAAMALAAYAFVAACAGGLQMRRRDVL